MKNLHYIIVPLLFALAILVAPVDAFAQAQPYNGGSGDPFNGSSGSAYNGSSGCGTGNGEFVLCNPLGVKNFCDLVKSLLNIVLAIGVPIAVLFLVWSGFRFILARGNPTELALARKNFMFVIVGIAIFLGAWTLATVISATIQTLDSSGTIQFCGR